MKLYHYTNGEKIGLILADGIIKAVPDNPKPGEKKIAWLSTNPKWEKTANKIVMIGGETKLLSMEQTESYLGGLYRIAFESKDIEELHIWPKISVVARIPSTIKKRLVKRAKLAKVRPEQWAGTIYDLPIGKGKLQKYNNGEWLDISPNDIPKRNSDILHATAKAGMISNSDWKSV